MTEIYVGFGGSMRLAPSIFNSWSRAVIIEPCRGAKTKDQIGVVLCQ